MLTGVLSGDYPRRRLLILGNQRSGNVAPADIFSKRRSHVA